MTALRLLVGRANLIATRCKIISNALFNASVTKLSAFMGPDEPTPVFTLWRNARTLRFQNSCQPSVGSKRSIHHYRPQFACFAVNMCPRISTRVFPQKGKSIDTGSGPHQSCLRLSMAVPEIGRAHV